MRLASAIAFVLATVVAAMPGQAQTRVALVISDGSKMDVAAVQEAAPLSAAGERALKPKDSFKECETCPQMVVTPSGSFVMGSPKGEEGRSEDEGPQQQIEIRKPFAVGRTEVSFEEWLACVAEGGCNAYRPGDYGWVVSRHGALYAEELGWGPAIEA